MMLKRKFSALVAAALMTPLASFAYLQHGEAGAEVFSFMGTFDGPRNIALEKSAGASPSTDPSVTQINPAAIRMADGKKHVVSMHWQTGDLTENEGSAFFTGKNGIFIYQLSYNWIDEGSIAGYDEWGNETGVDYEPFSQMVTATLSFPLKHFSFGTTIKFVSDRLAEEEGDRAALGAAFDWGILWQSASKIVGLSLVAKDFGYMIRDYVDEGTDEFYTMSQTFSISGYLRPKSVRRLTIFAASDFPRYADAVLDLGAEYALGTNFAIRAGFTRTWIDLTRDFKELAASNDRPSEANESRMLSAGLGYNNSLFTVDYAISYLTQGMGFEHRVGLSVGF
ncbi:MAG: hypothetical protein MJY99_07270 [Fibrobacter sp.]|uniref:hypothetical protein n=1 Tax=Fibrobacter sp. TaxID=35828 RepID=UPI00388E0B14|nr:hypothetical protein [Fibrobacter sp.]